MEGVTTEAPRPQKPALLKGGMVACWAYAALLALFLVVVQDLPPRGAAGSGVIAAGATVGGVQMNADTLISMRLFFIPIILISIVAAYGLAKDRYWSRIVMMLLLVLGVLLIPPALANPTDYALSIALAVFGWWYLYRKENVVRYYRTIKPGTTNGN